MFNDDFRQTTEDFKMIKEPLEYILGGEIMPIEGNSGLNKALDILCGIDYLLITDKGVRGIASRIQRGTCWHTFTIRAKKITGNKTEYEKRCDALQQDYIYPYYTMQAYRECNTITGAICKTRTLYEHIQDNDIMMRRTDNAAFYVVDWREITTVKFVVKNGELVYLQ